MSKAEVMNFLESAGFSRSNPYFMVQQGRISALATMRDEERLELLKEVAGTRVYDTRRDESAKIMGDTDSRVARVDEVLGYIGKRLAELESEQRELAEFERLDKRRRALEFALTTREHAECTQRLRELESERAAENERTSALRAREEDVHNRIREADRLLKAALSDATACAKEKDVASDERAELIRRRAKLELEVRDARERAVREKERARQTEEELGRAEAAVAEAETRLAEINPAFAAKEAEEDAARRAAADAERRTEELYAKQGRSAQFSTKEERDRWLQREIRSVRDTLAQRKAQQRELESECETLRAKATDEREQFEAQQAGMDARRQQIEQAQHGLEELRTRRDELMSSKREHQRRAFDLDTKAQNMRHELRRCEAQLEGTMSRTLSQGLAAVKRIVQERRLGAHVFGPVIENLDASPDVSTAVEVTAGNSLFHVIVDNDDTAAAVLEELGRLKIGRVTIMPLNRLPPAGASAHLPAPSEDAEPLIGRVKFADTLRPAFEHIFGKTLLCRSQEAAQRHSRDNGCNCVTLDGDQVNRRGVWTGGYYDPRASRLEAMRALKAIRAQLTANDAERAKLNDVIAELEQSLAWRAPEEGNRPSPGARHARAAGC